MAARINRIQVDQNTRLKIKAGQLIKRLQNYALTDSEDDKFLKKAMNKDQIRCAEILLKKLLPDIQSITIEGQMDHSLTIIRKTYEPKDSNGASNTK